MPFKAGKVKAIKTDSLQNLGASTVDLAKYVEDEFAQIASALQGNDPWQVLFVAPPKPRQGMLVYADGTHWNPGSGEGFYAYGSDAAWHRLEQPVPLAVSDGGTGDIGTAWNSYVVTVTTGTGTITAVGFWKSIGKTIFISLVFTFTSAVTGTIAFNLPVAAKRQEIIMGKEIIINGHPFSGQTTASSTNALLIDDTLLTFPTANGQLVALTGVYESV